MVMMMMNCSVEWLTDKRHYALNPPWTIVEGPHQCKPPTYYKQYLSLHTIWVQVEWSCVVVMNTTQRHQLVRSFWLYNLP